MKKLNVNLEYYDINVEKLIECVRPYIESNVMNEPEIYIYDNDTYKNMLTKKYPTEMEIMYNEYWVGAAFILNKKDIQIFIDLLHLDNADVESILINTYGYNADTVDDIFDNRLESNILLLDTVIHELRHVEMYMTEGFDGPNNSEELVKAFGVSCVKDYISKFDIPEIVNFKDTFKIKDFFQISRIRREEDYGILE